MLTRGTGTILSHHGRFISKIKPSSSSSSRSVGGGIFASPSSSNFYKSHSTCVAAAEEDDEEDSAMAMTITRTLAARGKTESNKKMPRLQQLRQRLEKEPPLPSILKTKTTHSSPKLQPKQTPLNDDNGLVQEQNREKILNLLAKAKNELKLSPTMSNLLTDRFNRHHSYLRISLSERCNLRCQYCMPPEGVPLQKQDKLLTDEEILELVDLFVEAGVKKIRLTGGEPLLRPSLPSLLHSISTSHPELTSLGITTNGLTLSKQLPDLIQSGLTHVNISLDTLHPDKFVQITRRKGLDRVLRAIDDTIDAFQSQQQNSSIQGKVKVNCVVMKNFNDNELYEFVSMTKDKPLDVRFIEWMPFAQNGWNKDRFVSYADMMNLLQEQHDAQQQQQDGSILDISSTGNSILQRGTDGSNDTTKWYSLSPNHQGRVGFITSMSQHFCNTCNRLRITADGNLKVCLFGSDEVSLRDALRMKDELEPEDLKLLVNMAVRGKKAVLGGHGSSQGIKDADDNRPMTLIGG